MSETGIPTLFYNQLKHLKVDVKDKPKKDGSSIMFDSTISPLLSYYDSKDEKRVSLYLETFDSPFGPIHTILGMTNNENHSFLEINLTFCKKNTAGISAFFPELYVPEDFVYPEEMKKEGDYFRALTTFTMDIEYGHTTLTSEKKIINSTVRFTCEPYMYNLLMGNVCEIYSSTTRVTGDYHLEPIKHLIKKLEQKTGVDLTDLRNRISFADSRLTIGSVPMQPINILLASKPVQ